MFQSPRKHSRIRTGWIGGLALLVTLALASLSIGSRAISPAETWQALTHFDPTQSTHLLVVELRLPARSWPLQSVRHWRWPAPSCRH